jgi:lipopolysaccharide export system protein LptA
MRMPLSGSNPFRPLMIGVAAAACLSVGTAHSANGLGSHNSNAPVNYEADRIDLDDKANHVVLSGHVIITQAELKMTAARTLVDYTNNNGSLKIKLINSTGGVVVTRNNESAVGDVGTYDFDRRVIVMSGNVTLRRGTDVSHGARLVVDLNTGLSNFVGAAARPGAVTGPTPGRVTGTFSVPEKKKDASSSDSSQ